MVVCRALVSFGRLCWLHGPMSRGCDSCVPCGCIEFTYCIYVYIYGYQHTDLDVIPSQVVAVVYWLGSGFRNWDLGFRPGL